MNPPAPELASRLIALLAALMLVVQLLMVTQRMLLPHTPLFPIQSLLLSGIAGIVAFSYHAPHVYLMAALTFAGKVIALPWFLRRLVRQTGLQQ
jgi:hydrogenase-4 component E